MHTRQHTHLYVNGTPASRTRGRLGTPAEVVVRLLLLKHIRNWSYEGAEREVRASLVYRSFTQVGGGKVPDDTVKCAHRRRSPDSDGRW